MPKEIIPFRFEDSEILPSQEGLVLATLEKGKQAGRRFEDLAQPNTLVVVDFAGVEVVSLPFCRGFFTELQIGFAVAKNRNMTAVLANVSSEAEDCLETSRSLLHLLPVAYTKEAGSEVDLMTDNSDLRARFLAAQALTESKGSFEVTDLAQELDMKVPAATGHLYTLIYCGAVGRSRDNSPKRGAPFAYQAVIDADLATQ